MICFGCGKCPDELAEYVTAAEDEARTPDEYVRREEGTYNRDGDTFCCTECYVRLGQPNTPSGWKAPALGERSACPCCQAPAAWAQCYENVDTGFGPYPEPLCASVCKFCGLLELNRATHTWRKYTGEPNAD